MKGAKLAVWLFITLMSLAYSGWYFASTPAVKQLDNKTLSTTVDTIVNDLTVWQYDVKGELVNYLETPLLHHIPLNNTHWLKTPYITVKPENQALWQIRSQQASATNGGKEITFDKKVIIHQDDPAGSSTFKTEKLTYYPKEKYAFTPLEVTFEQPGRWVK